MQKEESTYHHEDLKSELLEAGIRLVSEEGFQAFSLRKLALECNVSHQAPYSHFENKEKFLEEMQKYITEKFSAELQKTITACSKKANPLEELGKTYFSFFVDNPNYYHFLFGQANISLDLTKNADSEKNYRPYEIFKELVNQILIANKIKAARRNDVVISLWAYIHGLTSLATMKNVKYDCNWKSKLHDFITIFNCKELDGGKSE